MRNSKTIPDHQHQQLLEGVSFQPIFIMGDHRSGTTLLYQLLAATQCVNVVTAYHLICYDMLLTHHVNRAEAEAKKQLGDYFAALGLTDRLIDGVKVTPDLPEEYGFRLRNAGFKAQVSPKTLPVLMELCRKVQCLSDPGRPLLLKNPWDFLNFMYVKQAFPSARFIFIHRHPVHTINSQLRATRSLFQAKNPYIALIAAWYRRMFERPFQPHLVRLLFASPLGLRIVLRHVALATQYFLEHIARLPEADYRCVKYETLCREPRSTILAILDFLGMPGKSDADDGDLIQNRSVPLLDEVERNKSSIVRRLAPYLRYGGYEP